MTLKRTLLSLFLLLSILSVSGCSGEESKAKKWRDAVCKCEDEACLTKAFASNHGHEIDGIMARNEGDAAIAKYVKEGRKCQADLMEKLMKQPSN